MTTTLSASPHPLHSATPARRGGPAWMLALLALWLGAALPALAQQKASAPALVPGVDYALIDGGQAWRKPDAKARVEVVEVFAYWCGHCADAQPHVAAWKARLPKDVRFTYLPAAFDLQDTLARGYFATEALRLRPGTHDALYRAIHVDATLPRNPTAAELGAWYATRGVDARSFAAAVASPAMDARMREAREWQARSGVEGTPTFIVDGRYRILGKTREQVFANLDRLIAQLRR